jgi:hypothetical protein
MSKNSDRADNGRDRIVQAAQELVKAACAEVETSSVAAVRATAESLTHIHGNTTSMNKNILSMEASAAKRSVEETQRHTESLAKQQLIIEGNATIIAQQKIQILQWALLNTQLGTFEFITRDSQFQITNTKSTTVVSSLLSNAMTNCGINLSNNYMILPSDGYYNRSYTEDQLTAGRLAFRTALQSQMFSLTGKQPRLVKKEDGSYSMFL